MSQEAATSEKKSAKSSKKAKTEKAAGESVETVSIAAGPAAVIRTGGKQYLVSAGEKLLVEKLEGKIGDTVSLTDVLLVTDGTSTTIGTPVVSGASVKAVIVGQRRMKKVINFKKQRRTGFQRTRGHRQYQTEIRIESI
jgi:large subunit ribosomal protein L21